jgi:hypothetical protein
MKFYKGLMQPHLGFSWVSSLPYLLPAKANPLAGSGIADVAAYAF